MTISVAILAWFFVTVAGKLTIVPSKRQWMAEQAYGFVRNSIARDVIGAKDFKQFVPLLFMATVGLFFITTANFTPWNTSGDTTSSAIGGAAAICLFSW